MADKVVKCVLLNVDNVLITEIEEVMPEPGEPDCRLVNPYLFVSEDDMKPWVQASNQKEYMVRSDDILTIADPTQEVIDKYIELTS
jgi:hypothetical protein|tara:strand:- start:56 stop:313 length:258 start_codon:yes stop_codon:yes gene_type:complete